MLLHSLPYPGRRARKNGELNDSLCDFKWKLDKRESIAGRNPCPILLSFYHLAISVTRQFHIKSDIDVQKVVFVEIRYLSGLCKNIIGMENIIFFWNLT